MLLSDKNISNTVQHTAPAATKDKEVKILIIMMIIITTVLNQASNNQT